MLAILGSAAAFRLQNLGSIPYGISGDEATFGLEAERILDEGWIGPYSPYAAGQPAGVLYLGAVSVSILGKSFVALRLVPAIAGILTVLAVYAVARRSFGAAAGLVAAALMAVSSWAIHFSRFAIPVGVWPLLGLLTAGAVVEALRTGSLAWWACAGALAAAGVYVYDGHNVFLAILALFLAGTVAARRRDWRPITRGICVLAAAFALVALPMILWAARNPDGYLGHTRYNTIFNQRSWETLSGPGPKARFLTARYGDYWDQLCCQPIVDYADGTGLAPLGPAGFLGLAAFGMVFGLLRRRGPPVTLGVAIVLLMPLAWVFSEGGHARRAIVALPFLAIFAGVGTSELIRRAGDRRALVAAALVLLLGLVAYQSLDDYFGTFPRSAPERFVFAADLNHAFRYMKELPPNRHVYFYSSAASVTHEIRRFIAPDVLGEDRSREFGGNYSFAVEPDGKVPVFVFMDRYEGDVAEVRRLYPGGTTVVSGARTDPAFVAYLAPAGLKPG